MAASLEDIRARWDTALVRSHAVDRLLERGITPADVRLAIHSETAEIIEDYPDHHYGPACLVLGWRAEQHPLHVLIGVGPPLYVITAWDPSADPKQRWEADYRTRRMEEEES